MILTTLFCLLLAVAGLISVAYCLRGGGRRGRRAILCALRVAALTTVALSFIQPTLRFTRLAPPRRRVGVAVDVSGSMRLFDAGSVWHTLSNALRDASATSPVITKTLVAFGDSTRSLAPTDTPSFTDTRSLFPSAHQRTALADAREIILLSDGNWSNPSVPSPSPDANYHYVLLEQKHHRPYVVVEPMNAVETVPRDSASRATVRLSGYSPHEGTAQVVVRYRGTTMVRRSLALPGGHFSDSLGLVLPTSRVGTRLYEVTASLPDTNLRSSCYLVQRVKRHSIQVALGAEAPSLDKRFVALAVDRHPRLRRTSEVSKAEALLLFDRSRRSRAAAETFAHRGAVIYIGSPPCSSVHLSHPATVQPQLDPAYGYRLPASLPAPTALVRCDTAAPPILRPIMTGTATETTSTIPLLFEAAHEGRRVLVLAVRGIWRWDFWPRGIEHESAASPFTDFLMERIVELVETNANTSFYAFPAESPVYETDSLALELVFPAAVRDERSVPLGVTVIGEEGDTVHRSAHRVDPRASGTTRLVLPPLDAGVYRYDCRLSGRMGSFAYGDRLRVGASDAELRVTGQNRVLLNQIATPLEAGDTASIRLIAERLASAPQAATLTHTLRLRQSAVMLGLLLALLAVEWFLRRAWRLD
jgi:hypothetical protein